MNLGLKFSPQEEQLIKQKYDIKRNGRICWKQFSNLIETSFAATNFKTDPALQKVEPLEL